MEILIVGSDSLEEAQRKLGSAHQYRLAGNHHEAKSFLKTAEVVFDFIIEDDPARVDIYKDYLFPVFLNTSTVSLSLLGITDQSKFFGFCGMPTFFDREILEVSLLKNDNETALRNTCERLGTKFSIVADQVGLVTPRVICMIINEAYYTFEEGTATKEDIDQAMRLGTNYPYGPFEWCERIGKKNVCALLAAMQKAMGDQRYEISPALLKV